MADVLNILDLWNNQIVPGLREEHGGSENNDSEIFYNSKSSYSKSALNQHSNQPGEIVCTDAGEALVKCVQAEGGGEGEGEHVEAIYKIRLNENDYYVRVTGSYYSYDGAYISLTDGEVVTPKQVMVTIYE